MEWLGRVDEAEQAYRRAAAMTHSVPEQRFLNRRIARLNRAVAAEEAPANLTSALHGSAGT